MKGDLQKSKKAEWIRCKAALAQHKASYWKFVEIMAWAVKHNLWMEQFEKVDDFFEFCGHTKRYGYYLVEASEIRKDLERANVPRIPDAEKQLRELARVPKEKRPAVVKRLYAKQDNPGTSEFRKAADAIVGPRKKKTRSKMKSGDLISEPDYSQEVLPEIEPGSVEFRAVQRLQQRIPMIRKDMRFFPQFFTEEETKFLECLRDKVERMI